MCNNNSTAGQDMRALVHCLGGQNELVKTSQVSFVAGCRIEDFARVATLEVDAVTFPPLFPRQLYARTDMSVDLQSVGQKGPSFDTEVPFSRYRRQCLSVANHSHS